MLGLTLQGGGAKGAFQAGAVKALFEEGVVFDGVCGASIGAINGAMIVQGDIELLCNLWTQINMETVFGNNTDPELRQMLTETRSFTLRSILGTARKIFNDKGLDMSHGIEFISKYLNEEKIRKSSVDYGLVTVDIQNKTSKYLFKNDIPQGKMLDYIFASANFPLFKRQYIDNVPYMDGGVYDNLPINMLIEKGYDEIIAIRLGSSIAPVKKVTDKNVKITYIDPSTKPGTVLNFSTTSVERAILMGYMDTKRMFKGWAGHMYYIEPKTDEYAVQLLLKMDDSTVSMLSKELEISMSNGKAAFVFDLLNNIKIMLKIDLGTGEFQTLVMMMEFLAELYSVYRLKVFTFRDFVKAVFAKSLNSVTSEKTLFGKKKMNVGKILMMDIIGKI